MDAHPASPLMRITGPMRQGRRTIDVTKPNRPRWDGELGQAAGGYVGPYTVSSDGIKIQSTG